MWRAKCQVGLLEPKDVTRRGVKNLRSPWTWYAYYGNKYVAWMVLPKTRYDSLHQFASAMIILVWISLPY